LIGVTFFGKIIQRNFLKVYKTSSQTASNNNNESMDWEKKLEERFTNVNSPLRKERKCSETGK
jgi:hypothetical protein